MSLCKASRFAANVSVGVNTLWYCRGVPLLQLGTLKGQLQSLVLRFPVGGQGCPAGNQGNRGKGEDEDWRVLKPWRVLVRSSVVRTCKLCWAPHC